MTPPSSRRGGQTIVEVLGALAVIAIAGVGLVTMLAATARNARDRDTRMIAERILQNEADRLQMGSPWSGPAEVEVALNAVGEADLSGSYRLHLTRRDECNGGNLIQDSGTAVESSCGSLRATAVYMLRVRYPVRGDTAAIVRRWYRGDTRQGSGFWSYATSR